MAQWSDTTSLIRVQLAQLVALETLRLYHVGDTTVFVCNKNVTLQHVDTLTSASSSLRSDLAAEKTQTVQERPLMVKSKKRGVAWLRPLIVFGCVFFLALFLWFWFYVKKK